MCVCSVMEQMPRSYLTLSLSLQPEELHLSLNQLSGTIPTELGNLSNLRKLQSDSPFFSKLGMTTGLCLRCLLVC